jgi:hypothetical protein
MPVEIKAGTERVTQEVALDAIPQRIRFRVELSGLALGSYFFTRYRVIRRVVVDEKGK